MDGEKNLHRALNKSSIHFSPSPSVVFWLVIESTFPRIAGSSSGGGFQNKGQAAFCLGVVGSGHTCKVTRIEASQTFKFVFVVIGTWAYESLI